MRAAAGRNPRSFGGKDLIAIIEAAYDPLTGRYHPTFLFRHTLAIEALQRANLPCRLRHTRPFATRNCPTGAGSGPLRRPRRCGT